MHEDRNVPYGYCHCGCGEQTNRATVTRTRGNLVKGEPMRFLQGHSLRGKQGPDYVIEDRGYETPCWIWQKTETSDGYGLAYVPGRKPHQVRAHRLYYERAHGTIPDGLVLDHLCRMPLCVNPAHLEPVTIGENVIRGEGRAARNARKTHCVNGHAFDEENTAVVNGGRRCRACDREKKRRISWEEEARGQRGADGRGGEGRVPGDGSARQATGRAGPDAR